MTTPDPTTPPTPPAAPAEPEPKPAQAKAEVDWKAEARKHEARAKENAAAAAELAALKEAQKTEAEKLADRVKAAERERDEARLEALRAKVGAAKKLPADVVDLLKGDTEEELTAHADRLAAHFTTGPRADVDQGVRGAAAPQSPREEFAKFIQARQ